MAPSGGPRQSAIRPSACTEIGSTDEMWGPPVVGRHRVPRRPRGAWHHISPIGWVSDPAMARLVGHAVRGRASARAERSAERRQDSSGRAGLPVPGPRPPAGRPSSGTRRYAKPVHRRCPLARWSRASRRVANAEDERWRAAWISLCRIVTAVPTPSPAACSRACQRKTSMAERSAKPKVAPQTAPSARPARSAARRPAVTRCPSLETLVAIPRPEGE